MYPNLLFFHPDLAHGTVMYRVNGLGWAKQYAADTGRMGARYPWQTAASGKVASHANAEEIHIVSVEQLPRYSFFAFRCVFTGLIACLLYLSFADEEH